MTAPYSKRLIVGIGNPGKKYEMTRHNIGFILADAITQALGSSWKEESRFSGCLSKGTATKGVAVHVLKPSTFVNLSGQAMRKVLDYYKYSAEELIVLVDDVALPFGSLRIRQQGSSGGHNGLKSIEQCLGTQTYLRIRIGIGQEREQQSRSNHVLGRFTATEQDQLVKTIDQALTVVKKLLTEDVTTVMNQVNMKLNSKTKTSNAPQKGQENKDERNSSESL
jgi:PTH1 family peptidyl-tRNA hydrolase